MESQLSIYELKQNQTLPAQVIAAISKQNAYKETHIQINNRLEKQLRKLKKWFIYSVFFNKKINQYSELSLRDITNIEFEKLVKYNLASFCTLGPMPKIDQIKFIIDNIDQNNLISLQPLIKLKSKQLQKIDIEKNYIQEGNMLSKIDRFYPTKISIEYFYIGGYQFHSINFMAKLYLDSSNIINLSINSQNRINQQPIMRKLKQKSLNKLFITLHNQQY